MFVKKKTKTNILELVLRRQNKKELLNSKSKQFVLAK